MFWPRAKDEGGKRQVYCCPTCADRERKRRLRRMEAMA